MDFVAVVDQAITLLRQRGRLTYRTLQLQFQLDDVYLEALKDEIIFGQRLAVDEEGKVLVWTGGTSSAPVSLSPVPPPATLDVSPTPSEAPPIVSPPPDAERRQLTVMFCDLVDSTTLSGQLDPEEYRDIVRAYQRVCTEVIQRYDGHIAQLLGDGLLIYFGYPQAHEDDAQRAVRTGLGMLVALGDLNQGLHQAKGMQLGVRLGMHTGLVVVGDMGSAGRQEQLALGEVPNIAARIEALAAPNTVAISEATYRLVQGYFACEALGAQTLRGVSEPVAVYRVDGESGATSRLEVAQGRGLTPLVGRESEVALLLERWEQAKTGHGQVVLLTGDAGIGKSRLVQTLKDHVAHEPHLRWECRSAEYAQNTVLFPLVDLFQRLLRFEAHETPDARVEKLEQALCQYRLPLEESLPLFAPLLSLPIPEERYPALHVSPQRQRQKTLETLVALLQALAAQQPMLFIVEDLHWTDPTTLELLNLVLDQTPTAAMLVLLTCRPHFQPSWHHRSYLTEITVNRLSHTQVAQVVNRMTDGKTLPTEVLQQILGKTDGVPLFVEELTKAILESEQLTAVDGHYEFTGSLSTVTIPATLQDSLMARLDRLVTAKGVAQMGATIGRQFAYELLQAVSPLDALTLQRELQRLVEAEIVYQRGVPPHATYVFKHALIQDAAYASLLKSTRQHSHQRIAQVLEAQFPETVETQPELLAHHYTEAGLAVQALSYWQRAGERAIQHSAYVEAIRHLTRGLAVLRTLPKTRDRTRYELTFQITLGPTLMVTRGFAAPEAAHAYARARELCQQLGEVPQLFSALWGLWLFYNGGGQLQTARDLGAHLLDLAQRQGDPALLLQAHHALGPTLYQLGEPSAAHARFAQALALYDPQHHHAHAALYGGHDPGVCCHGQDAWTLWLLGYPAQAVQQSHAAVTLAQQLGQRNSLAHALILRGTCHQFRREAAAARACAEAALTLATEHGFAYHRAASLILQGWAVAEEGHREEGRAQIARGLAAYQALGIEAYRTHFLAIAAQAEGRAGAPDAGLRLLEEALTVVHTAGERFWEAEVHRLRGELLLTLASPDEVQAEACLQQAWDIARHQQARSLELRAAMSLARLWSCHGKRAEARQLLAEVYGWFTEGFDTADLQEAKALLDELA